jgi:hypothetical protein
MENLNLMDVLNRREQFFITIVCQNTSDEKFITLTPNKKTVNIMSKKGLVLAGILVFCIGIALAAATNATFNEVAETRAMITGTVSDAETGDAIADAEVNIPELEASTITDENGSFSFYGIGTGSYTISVSADGYQSYSEVVRVNDEESTFEIDITLES